jgi:hypothetical protein
VTERAVLAAELRTKGAALNVAIVAFNLAIEPLSRAVGQAQDAYNGTLDRARILAGGIVEAAQGGVRC